MGPTVVAVTLKYEYESICVTNNTKMQMAIYDLHGNEKKKVIF